jgi:hypothetical protein
VQVTGSNVFASFQEREKLHERYARHSLWWSWTPPASGVVSLNTQGSEVLSVVTVYETDAGGFLQRVSGGVDADDGTKTEFTFLAVYGKNYEIAMDGYADETGNQLTNLTVVALNDNRDGLTDWTQFPVRYGVTYRIQVETVPWIVPDTVTLSSQTSQTSQPAEIVPLSLPLDTTGPGTRYANNWPSLA